MRLTQTTIWSILGMWTGAYAFDGTNGESEFSSGYTPPSDLYKKPYHFYNIDNGNYQPAGFALWAALSDYRIPRLIEDFFLNKHNGWIVKNQTNFYKYEYWYDWATNSMPNTTPIIPNYFGTGGSSSELHPVSQSFFVTNDFLNSGGGVFDQYADPQICVSFLGIDYCRNVDEINQWNAIAKPLMLMTKGDVGYGGQDGKDLGQLEQRFLMNIPGNNVYDGKVLGIYKSFSLGFDPHGLGLFRVPTSWNQNPMQTVSKNGMQYTVYDFRSSSNGLRNYYLILATALTFSHAYGNSVYAGWWEVVPGAMYPSLSALASYISSNNPNLGGSTAAQPKAGEQYKYKMASSGDVITVNFDLSSTKDVSIASIVDRNNADVSSLVFANNNTPATAITTVWEVDQNYQLTNLKYAENPTEGKIIIRNPFISSPDFIINSIDYANPSSSNPYRVPVNYKPPMTAVLSLLMN